MTKLDHRYVLIGMLGLGAADLGALNLWALPGALTVTEADAASDALQPKAAVAAPSVKAALPPPAAKDSPKSVPEANALILFGRGSWTVGRRGRATLRSVVAGLSREQMIEIDGHADAAGPEDLNQRISEERADAVAAVFRRFGMPADQIQVRAFGEHQPSRDGRSRRVEIRIRGAL